MKQLIQVYEHQSLKVGQEFNQNNGKDFKFEEEHLNVLSKYHGSNEANKFPYYTLINKGVKFKEYVGVLQIGNLTIEVLPKVDNPDNTQQQNKQQEFQKWQGFLINMLRTVGVLEVKSTGFSSLKTQQHSLLKLYFEYFLQETNYLLRTGLIKKYRKESANCNSLKGRLLFSKNIQHNVTRADRFYVNYTAYNQNTVFNQILYKTLRLLREINTSNILYSEIEKQLLHFPELTDLKVSEKTFDNLVYSRKTDGYKKAISIAKHILLNFHPDIKVGSNEVLALMFDMNKLWEKYLLKRLAKELGDTYQFSGQVSTLFWEPEKEKGNVMNIKPDIVIKNNDSNVCNILDTKWKVLKTNRPADDDIKQMLTYNLYSFENSPNNRRSALVYPSFKVRDTIQGKYFLDGHGHCSLVFVTLDVDNDNNLNLEYLKTYIKAQVSKES